MKGFFNKILYIDLSNESFHYQDITDDLLGRCLGGKGLGAHLLMKENEQGVDPLSKDNVFIIATGPITGTMAWSQSRFGAYTKSPATGGFGESYCGGSLAPKIKGCGVDAIVIKGGASKLSYLAIDESGVKFCDATAILQAETFESEDYILKDAPKGAGAMVIGPAGENLVRFACIKSDKWRSLGRGGLGAVWGAKNLKGISFSGKKKCEIANQDLLKKFVKIISQKGKESPVTALYQKLGTPMQVKVMNAKKGFPTRYWQKGYFDGWEKLSADYMQENFEVSQHPCPTCFLRCTKHSVVKNGRHKGLELEGPEFETIYALGGLSEIDSLEEVAWLNVLCDKLGIDTMSAGNIAAFAVEAHKASKIDFEIDYNQPDRIAELFGLISKGEGVGKIFQKGIKEASKELGLEDIAIHVKGLEPAGFDPRVLKGMGLSYATSARGACHLRGTFYKAELSGMMDPDQIKGKAKLLIDFEDRAAIFDSMVLCRFFRDYILWDELLMLIEATTGKIYTKEQLADLANETTNLTRRYNHREGLDSSTDTLPKRFLTEATKEGATMSREDLDMMIKEYNELRSKNI
ncbi:MAG: aldehyde ferredoxin oxidoreductase family protein [Bacteriovoracaceae bacterium]|nr:aldehyde ferredoxin oxidoreductase family protein [Bacteriovoracaceae bacterium]